MLGAGLACAALIGSAHASLGQKLESIEADRARMGAKVSAATPSPAYAVHTLTLPDGSVVREFAGQNGLVFGVAWHGHGRPDLRQLLGQHFEALQADTTVRAGRRLRVPLAVSRTDLIVRTGGHPGAFWGMAYLPQATPAGVSARDLQTP